MRLEGHVDEPQGLSHLHDEVIQSGPEFAFHGRLPVVFSHLPVEQSRTRTPFKSKSYTLYAICSLPWDPRPPKKRHSSLITTAVSRDLTWL